WHLHVMPVMRDIRGAAALITGSAERIGRAIALALADQGVNVVVHYRNSATGAEELARSLGRIGVSAWTLRADLRNQDELDDLVDRAIDLSGGLQILVNNASAFPRSTFEDMTHDDLVRSIETDAWAPFALARQFARRVGRGHIVNLLDTRIAAQFDWQHFAYCAAKDLFRSFTSLMALRLAPRVVVNAVAPGLILPPEGKTLADVDGLESELPLRRFGDPTFVAEAVLSS